MSASRSGSTADGSSWIVKQVGSSLSKSRQCETASTSIIRNHRTIDGALCTNLPVTCGQYMLIDARMRWAFGPVPKSRTSSPSHVRGVNRPVVRTQLSGPKQQAPTPLPDYHFSHKSFAPLLRGHHPGGRRGLAAPGIASPSDGVGKPAFKLLPFSGRDKTKLREETGHQLCLSSTAQFPLPLLLLEKVLRIRLPNRLLKIRSGVTFDEDLPVEHQQRFGCLRFFAHLSKSNRVSNKSGLYYCCRVPDIFKAHITSHTGQTGAQLLLPFQTIANGSFNATV